MRMSMKKRKCGLTVFSFIAAAAKSRQSCPTLCDPRDSSPPGSPVPGILQARTLEWVAISFSNAWKWKVKLKSLSRVRLLATPWSAAHQAPPSMGFSRQEYWSGVPLPSRIYTVHYSSNGAQYMPYIHLWRNKTALKWLSNGHREIGSLAFGGRAMFAQGPSEVHGSRTTFCFITDMVMPSISSLCILASPTLDWSVYLVILWYKDNIKLWLQSLQCPAYRFFSKCESSGSWNLNILALDNLHLWP